MNELPLKSPVADPDRRTETERTQQVTVVGWTAGVSAFFALVALGQAPTWPVAFGVAAVMAMVALICHLILKREG